ncbi:hypothetical protein RD792_000847 [Penstemon davidsonii]|uniref:WAT1-related protein n=1 Tax=Penstemon davidsonii TaxID=160366 RepID=A0ABR0DLU4_9LAMI|nr:hypothetical protein RD792_000847 [Penstemon davidsonii]
MRNSVVQCAIFMKKQRPYIAMIIIQFIYAGMFLFSKASISSGMKPSVFATYRQAFATLALTPFALFYERKGSHALTFRALCKIFVVSSCGISVTLNLHYAGLHYVSATVATAIPNTTPTVVFILAVCLRMERLAITKKHGMAKVLGSILGLLGAMAFTFYKGPPLYSSSKNELAYNSTSHTKTYSKEEWIKGSLILFAANSIWCIWLIMQPSILKEYPAKLRLTTLQCGLSCVTTTIYGAIRERDISSWKLGWDFNLLSVAYCGVVVTGITYWLQVWVVDKKGPVFAGVFGPLALAVTAIFSALFLNETLHWGSILGGALLISGLYSFLWGKNKEAQSSAKQNMDPSKEEAQLECIVTVKSPADEQEKETRKI